MPILRQHSLLEFLRNCFLFHQIFINHIKKQLVSNWYSFTKSSPHKRSLVDLSMNHWTVVHDSSESRRLHMDRPSCLWAELCLLITLFARGRISLHYSNGVYCLFCLGPQCNIQNNKLSVNLKLWLNLILSWLICSEIELRYMSFFPNLPETSLNQFS